MNEDQAAMHLRDARLSGVYAVGRGGLGGLAVAARDAGLKVLRVDLDACADKPGLLSRISHRLDFPHGWGGNWDALSDALRDLSWLPASGYALLFGNADDLRQRSREDFDMLLDVLSEAAARWAGDDVPFWAFFELDDIALDDFEPDNGARQPSNSDQRA